MLLTLHKNFQGHTTAWHTITITNSHKLDVWHMQTACTDTYWFVHTEKTVQNNSSMNSIHTFILFFPAAVGWKISSSLWGGAGRLLKWFLLILSNDTINKKKSLCSPSLLLVSGTVGEIYRHTHTHTLTCAHTHWDTPIVVPRCSLWRWRLSEGEPTVSKGKLLRSLSSSVCVYLWVWGSRGVFSCI